MEHKPHANYFEFFDLPVAFVLDEAALRKAYLRNSKQYHPDFHTLADEALQAEMLERSTFNNEAYQTLSDPDKRMRYVLQLNGLLGSVGEEGGSDKVALPQDFLMDMMEFNEAMMDLEFDFDPVRYAQTLEAVQRYEQELASEVQPILGSWSEGGNPADLQVVKNFFLKKRYLLRSLEKLFTFAASNDKTT